MKTNNKTIRQKLNNHIEEHLNYQEYEGCENLHDAVVLQVNAIINNKNDTVYNACKRMVEGAFFLVYNEDIRLFVDSLGVNNKHNKHFEDYQVFTFYSHLLALELEKIYNA